MKKLPLVISLAGLLLLAGCGDNSASNEDQEPKSSTNSSNENESKPSTDDQAKPDNENKDDQENTDASTNDNDKNEDTSTGTEEKPTEEPGNNDVATAEMPLKYQINGEAKEDVAKLVKSDGQGYSMYLLPEYELTGEEPNKDLLYAKNAEHLSMRIELLQPDTDWATYEGNVVTELEGTNKTITNPTEAALQIPSAKIYEANNGQDVVTIYLVQNQQQPMKLTLFTTVDEDYRQAFVEMAKTITKK